MKATDVIAKCDNIKPNEYSQNQKRLWLNKIESDIREYKTLYSDNIVNTDYISEENPVLNLSEEDSDIYVYYLISMIDLTNQEFQLYNNSAAYFNSLLSDWKKKYRRTHLPKCSHSVKV